MPILLRTQVERTAKTPVTARRARVGSLCGFRGAAERVPAGSPKTGRCAAVRECCGNAKHRKRAPAGDFGRRKRRGRTKPRGRARPAAVTSARRAGSFGDLRRSC